jgi:hypothetical protein
MVRVDPSSIARNAEKRNNRRPSLLQFQQSADAMLGKIDAQIGLPSTGQKRSGMFRGGRRKEICAMAQVDAILAGLNLQRVVLDHFGGDDAPQARHECLVLPLGCRENAKRAREAFNFSATIVAGFRCRSGLREAKLCLRLDEAGEFGVAGRNRSAAAFMAQE